MKKYTLFTPEGMRDTLFEECKIRRQTENTLFDIAEKNGYREISTPIFEFYDVFDHRKLNFPQENLYKFTDNKGRLMVLRPDVSLPIARSAATRLRNEELPLRLFYAQDVFRVNNSDTGKKSSMRQVGAELIGNADDLEIFSLATDFLKSFNKPFTLEIGHIGIFKHLTKKLKENEEFEKLDTVRNLIARKNSPELNNMDIDTALKQLPKMFGKAEVFEKCNGLYPEDILDYLKDLYEKLSKDNDVIIDLGLVNKINYYTGVVFKGYVGGVEVLSGGRYDDLIGKFGYNVPAMGFALYLDDITEQII
ncbi:MAG: ATP phosphoribosyltransferase regulatory subunit [Oscillospiraceae bacterium]|jgi:ATP phosphoribosyltransferase regulatory subunit|nr:ATP phosphoribosyltransferase regulatory subunit [Oscillospiraceae bacterium]